MFSPVERHCSIAMPANQRLHVVEYLRGLAALAVAWFHLTNTYNSNWVRSSGAYGWLGVEVFFVISGFIIPYAISTIGHSYSIRDFPRFMLRRLVRLEPPYLASVALALVLWYISSLVPGFKGIPPANDVGRSAAHLLYLVPLTGYDWLQPVYWTLAWEFMFYIMVGLLFPWFGTRQFELRLAVLLTALAALTYLQVVSQMTLLFSVGICAQRLFDAAWLTPSEAVHDSEITIAVFGALMVFTLAIIGRGNSEIAFVGGITALLIVALPAFSLCGPLGRVLNWLGTISYSLYLTHVPVGGRVVNFGSRFVDEPAQQFLLSLTALGCCLSFAAAFHALIERPAVNWGRQFRRRSGLGAGTTPNAS